MKKVLFAVVLSVLLLVLALPIYACAETTQESEINKLVCEKEKVLDAKSVVYNGYCVLAIKTEKFVSKSDYEAFKGSLKRELENKFKVEVVITRSPKAMHFISDISELPEAERENAAKKFIEKELERPHRLPDGIQPR